MKNSIFNQQICAAAHIEKQSFSIVKSRVMAKKYVRIQGREIAYQTGKPRGIFVMC